jgi:hypothetical protein
MDDQILRDIHRRIDEHHAYLSDRLDTLHETVRMLHGELANRLVAHEAYHRDHEHRFGLLRLVQRYPLRFAALAFVAGGVVLAAAPEPLRRAAGLVGTMIRQVLLHGLGG